MLLKRVLTSARLVEATCLRTASYRYFADDHSPAPTCANKGSAKKDDKAKEADECVDDHPKPRARKDIEKTFPFHHLFKFNKECCDSECAQFDNINFDQCLYKESDKNARKYQVTWVECPPMAIKPKKICCFPTTVRPPIARRRAEDKPDTACMPVVCPIGKNEKCPKVKMPRCRPVRASVRCHTERYPSDCLKVKAPYPAFSECQRNPLRKKRPNECNCLQMLAQCELNYHLNRRLKKGALSFSPCRKS